MPDKSDGDFSRYEAICDLGPQVPAVHVQAQPAPTINAGHHQAPAFGFQPRTCINSTDQHHQPQMPAPLPAYGFHDATLVQGHRYGAQDDTSWIDDMLAASVVRPPASISLYDQAVNLGEEELGALARSAETAIGCAAEEDHGFTPIIVHGQLDCTNCRTVREDLHESENHKAHFTSHGQYQHTIFNRMGTGSLPGAPHPVTLAEEDDCAGYTFEAFDWAGFHPEILESSQVTQFDGVCGTSATVYPSLRDKLREREQTKLSKQSTKKASKFCKKGKKDSNKDPNISSPSFKLSCSKDNTFHKYSCRINELSRMTKKLEEETTAKAGSTGQIVIKQRIEMYTKEKEELFDTI
ncbi:hypothetical protein EJB05_32946, partial [Eragrostis curvula]